MRLRLYKISWLRLVEYDLRDDFDNDGDMDIVLGNQGFNNQFAASVQKP
jgi:hypothetical protein